MMIEGVFCCDRELASSDASATGRVHAAPGRAATGDRLPKAASQTGPIQA